MCSKAVGVVHRILCYQKRCKIRLVYNWKELWSGNKHYNLIVIIMCSLYQILIRYFVHLALVNLLKFFVTSEDHLLPKFNIFLVSDEVNNKKKSIYLTPYVILVVIAAQVIKIFNLFITYGDTFLPNPTTYDELYYELIRVYKVFDDLYSIGKSSDQLQNNNYHIVIFLCVSFIYVNYVLCESSTGHIGLYHTIFF